MLQQKIHNANEYIRFQEAHLIVLSSDKAPGPLSSEDPTPELSSNGRFLYDMIQQVTVFIVSYVLALHFF